MEVQSEQSETLAHKAAKKPHTAQNSIEKSKSQSKKTGKQNDNDNANKLELERQPTPGSIGTNPAQSEKADIANAVDEANSEAEKPVKVKGKPYSTKRAKAKQARHHAAAHKPKAIKHKKQPVKNSHAGKRAGK